MFQKLKILIGLVSYFLLAVSVPSQSDSTGIEIAAVGDILLDRGVDRKILESGPEYPFEKTLSLLSAADLSFGNLENPLTDRCDRIDKKFSFNAKPEYAGILSVAGFDVLSLANNHSLDCGRIGTIRTMEVLANHKILTAGAGYASADDDPTAIVLKEGVKVGFAAFTSISPVAQGEKYEGVSKADPDAIVGVIGRLKKRVDIVVVSFHWGTEYALDVNRQQVELARMAVDSGADIVLGHHPHVLQRIEVINRGTGQRKALVAYSLGNFVFDSPVRLNRHVGDSLILKIRVDAKGLLGASIVPVSVVDYRPVPAKGGVRERILNRMTRISREFGTEIANERVLIEDDKTKKDCDRDG